MDLSTDKHLDDTGIPSLEILVVDDDELSQRLMRVLLTREGHRVEVASNGFEAIEAVKRKIYDIVFMDLQMPGMGGIEASRQIRAWENGGSHTFIVALTASYLPENGQALFDAGMDNYIAKPFEIEHIQQLLRYSFQAGLKSSSAVQAMEGEAKRHALAIRLGIQQVGGDSEAYRDLLTDFIQELPEKIRLMRRFWDARELEKLARAAHNLKGVAANLGAIPLSKLAHRLDEQSSTSYTDSLEGILNDLEAAANILSAFAHDFLNNKENG